MVGLSEDAEVGDTLGEVVGGIEGVRDGLSVGLSDGAVVGDTLGDVVIFKVLQMDSR